jgi:hypothetical protein
VKTDKIDSKDGLGDLAFKTTDKPYLQEQDLMQVGEHGTPSNKILIDLDVEDIASYWTFHERKLWIIAGLCGIWFLMIFMSGF